MPEQINWTEGQRTAMTDFSSMIVSAAAGSGKTEVLSRRVVNYIVAGGSAEDLLIVTFTRLAAAEMRSRIAKHLAQTDDADDHIRLERLMLYKADISTIDSFFGDIVRKNFKQAGVQPDFGMLSDAEAALIRRKVLSEMLEKHYSAPTAEFEMLLQTLGGEKLDEGLYDGIDRLYDSVMSLPFPKKWMSEKLKNYSSASRWIDAMCEDMLKDITECVDVYDEVISSGALENFDFAYAEFDALKALRDALAARDWDGACAAARYRFVSLQGKAKKFDSMNKMHARYRLFRSYAQEFFKQDEKLISQVFLISEETVKEELELLRPSAECLFALTGEYIDGVFAEMGRKNKYSFDVISQLALALVVKEESYDFDTGNFEATDYTMGLREKYAEVLVDEYQDTNDLQDAFFKALTNNGRGPRFFAVGDVKQSIYGFRNANPHNFMRRYKEAQKRVDLSKNFRSRRGVLDFVNFVCGQLFSEDVGGVEYDRTQALEYGNPDYKERVENDVEVNFLAYDPLATSNAAQSMRFATMAARRIKKAVAEETVTEKKITRAMRYGDIAVLLPTFKNIGPVYQRVFEEAGIPYVSKSDSSYLTTVEVATVIALLKVIDDPYRDVPLFAVMYSDLFRFSADELAEIRLCDRRVSLYDAVKKAAENGDGKCAEFISTLDKYRLISNDFPVHKLIWRIYTDTSYPEAVACTYSGKAKRDALMQFYTFARDYGQNGDGDLYRFIQYVESADKTAKADNSMPTGGDCVKIMTVHASKGLEFPMCIVSYAPRENSEKGTVMGFDRELGVAMRIRNAAMTFEKKTLMNYAVSSRAAREDVSENLRLCYVALTRAREKLVLYFALKKDISPNDAAGEKGDKISPLHVSQLSGARDKFFAALARHPDFDVSKVVPFDVEYLPCESHADINWAVSAEKLSNTAENSTAQEEFVLDTAELDRRFAFRYTASHIPAKVSVTEIAKNKLYDCGSAQMVEPEFSVEKPMFLSDAAAGTARGTAIHTFLACADLEKDITAQAKALLDGGRISEQGYEAIIAQREAFDMFKRSELYALIKSADDVRREENFVVRIPASKLSPDAEGTVLMQGAIDLMCEYADGFVVVDYKTDRADSATISARYTEQLKYYAYAVQKCYGKPVKRLCIWSFHLGYAIDIPTDDIPADAE